MSRSPLLASARSGRPNAALGAPRAESASPVTARRHPKLCRQRGRRPTLSLPSRLASATQPAHCLCATGRQALPRHASFRVLSFESARRSSWQLSVVVDVSSSRCWHRGVCAQRRDDGGKRPRATTAGVGAGADKREREMATTRLVETHSGGPGQPRGQRRGQDWRGLGRSRVTFSPAASRHVASLTLNRLEVSQKASS
ncbi:unnamed protein product [Protopolystoma xenopodis]|uniref:Uncharacterized protein n=1 Tax=Protopolystoma xenopodis TaxID=117903 RepID=A0A3S5BBN6_9PLAT|nr:unnamed protein product [Protopolystoma xenopodis]